MATAIYTGRLGGALKMEPANLQHVEYPASPKHDFGIQDNFTYSIIVRPKIAEGGPSYRFIGKHFLYGYGLQIDWYLGDFYFLIRNYSPTDTYMGLTARYAQSLLDNRITHVDFVKYNANPGASVSSAEWGIYANGLPLAKSTLSAGPAITPGTNIKRPENPIWLVKDMRGQTSSGSHYSDFKVFNRALTASEIRTKYQRDGVWVPSDADTSLVLWSDFNLKNGKQVPDISGNNLPGSLIGFTDVETATNGAAQSGNTAWVDTYTELPYTTL